MEAGADSPRIAVGRHRPHRTGHRIGGVFPRAQSGPALRESCARHLGIALCTAGHHTCGTPSGGSTTWASFDHDTEHLGAQGQPHTVNAPMVDLDAMVAQLRAREAGVTDATEPSEYGRFAWAVDPKSTRSARWQPPPQP